MSDTSDDASGATVAPAPTPGRRAESRAERQARIAAKVRELPLSPGCYLMKDRRGEIFYIGKASQLRTRVRSYFGGSDSRQFVAWLDDLLYELDVILVNTETEALLLERTLIRQHQPRFNVLLRDDKNFIHLRLDLRKAAPGAPLRARYPRLEVVRTPRDDGTRYFGPFHSASAARASLRLLNRHFQLRTCSDAVLENRKRPCLQHQIGRCPAPCVYDVPDYSDRVQDTAMFLAGKRAELERRLEERMWQAAEDEQFEVAARFRDQIDAITTAFKAQAVQDVGRQRDQDIIAAARAGPHLEVVRVIVRQGGMRGTDHFSFENQEFPTEELLTSFLVQLYGDLTPQDLPDEVLIALDLEDDGPALAQLLSERRGRRVDVKRPVRGHRQRLIEIAQKNADASLAERVRKLDHREQSLAALQKRLRLPRRPRVMECFDISIFQGADPVASQVCFVDGEPEKSRYRRYNIKTVEGTDDFRMLYEALTRRLRRGLVEGDLPDLLLVDGGKGQLQVAIAACRDLKVDTSQSGMFIASIAKARALGEEQRAREGPFPVDAIEGDEIKRSPERVFVPGAKDPIVLRPHTPERYLVERLRDEAHRFAITGHRNRRKRRTLTSKLDEIPGIGPSKRRTLLQTLGSLRAAQTATLAELQAVPGIGPQLARTIYLALRPPSTVTPATEVTSQPEPDDAS